jgi:hypothetical protein
VSDYLFTLIPGLLYNIEIIENINKKIMNYFLLCRAILLGFVKFNLAYPYPSRSNTEANYLPQHS